jgi:hypothetical protein
MPGLARLGDGAEIDVPYRLWPHSLGRAVIGVTQKIFDVCHCRSFSLRASAARARDAVDETVPRLTPSAAAPLLQLASQRCKSAGRGGRDGSAADSECGCDLVVRQIQVVAQSQHLAGPCWEVGHGGEHGASFLVGQRCRLGRPDRRLVMVPAEPRPAAGSLHRAAAVDHRRPQIGVWH